VPETLRRRWDSFASSSCRMEKSTARLDLRRHGSDCQSRERRFRNMKRILMISMLALSLAASAAVLLAAQRGPAEAGKPAGNVPRTADGHPDLSGVWWRGSDIGGRAAPGTPGALGGAGRGAGPQAPSYNSLYNAEAQQKAKSIGDKDDPSLR